MTTLDKKKRNRWIGIGITIFTLLFSVYFIQRHFGPVEICETPEVILEAAGLEVYERTEDQIITGVGTNSFYRRYWEKGRMVEEYLIPYVIFESSDLQYDVLYDVEQAQKHHDTHAYVGQNTWGGYVYTEVVTVTDGEVKVHNLNSIRSLNVEVVVDNDYKSDVWQYAETGMKQDYKLEFQDVPYLGKLNKITFQEKISGSDMVLSRTLGLCHYGIQTIVYPNERISKQQVGELTLRYEYGDKVIEEQFEFDYAIRKYRTENDLRLFDSVGNFYFEEDYNGTLRWNTTIGRTGVDALYFGEVEDSDEVLTIYGREFYSDILKRPATACFYFDKKNVLQRGTYVVECTLGQKEKVLLKLRNHLRTNMVPSEDKEADNAFLLKWKDFIETEDLIQWTDGNGTILQVESFTRQESDMSIAVIEISVKKAK